MSRRNIIIGIVAVVALGALFMLAGGGSALAPKPTPTLLPLSELEYFVNASGTLQPVKRANLSFKIPGQVVQVAVKENDAVKRGDVLVKLDAADLEAAVAAVQAQLAQLKAGATKEEIAVAQANLDAARAQLAKVRAGATQEELAIAKANLERAEANLRDAQSQYDRVKDDPQVGMYPQSQALHLATQDYRIARARYEQALKGATAEDIRVAEAAVAAAQANFDRVKAGARPEEIAAAQARLDQANAALAAATLAAPFDGTIAAVYAREGEAVTPGVTLIALGDLSELRLETDDLSETNIAKVRVGQSAVVTFEALPGKKFSGKVLTIAPIASQKQGGTNYAVTVQVADLDPALRWGMTGHIEINVRQ